MKQFRLLFFVITLFAIPAIVFGQLPRTLSYQGVLTDTLGTPKPDGTYSFTFRLFESSGGGTAIWTEQKTLQVKRGLFSTLLGDQVIIGNAIRFDRPYWLGIQLAADPEMIPRIEMSSVGYSRRAEKADTATYALSALAQLFVDSARVAATIPDGVVTTNKLANNAVTSGKIASAQVVKSINTLKDDVTLAAGANVTITPSGSTLTIAASGGGGGNVSGTGATSQVPFWTGTSSIGGDNGLVWDNTNKRLGVGLSSPLDALQVNANTGNAVFGNALAATGPATGVNGSSTSSSGQGVLGFATSSTGTTYGVHGLSYSSSGVGVFGNAPSTTGFAVGVWGASGSSTGRGVYGIASSLTGSNYGLYGLSTSTSGTGVYGEATSTGVATTYGVYGTSASSTGRGVRGEAPGIGVEGSATSTTGYGVYGVVGVGGTSGIAVKGIAQSSTGTTYGLHGLSYSSSGTGAYGEATSATGTTYGLYGLSNSSSGRGVYGEASATGSVITYGVYGASVSSSGHGVFGVNTSATGFAWGVTGTSFSSNGTGVYGFAQNGSGNTRGVYGLNYSSSGTGVYGAVNSSTGTTYGVYGLSFSSSGTGLYGDASSTTGTTYGVYGASQSPGGAGVYGWSNSHDGVVGKGQRWGVYGTNYAGAAWGYLGGNTTGVYGNAGGVGSNNAGVFDGNVTVNGTLSKSAGSFKIDHPLDPANKYLYHSFVESPDMMNVYNGNVRLDARGEAWVELPAYFEALNSDYRYQLTAIGAPGPNLYIAQKISGNRFKIAGGQPGMEVSWQATGIRQDAFAKAHRIIPEVAKTGKERGKYIHPKEHGVSEMMGKDYDEIHRIEEEQAKMKSTDEQQRIKAREERDRMQVEEQRVDQLRRHAEEQRAGEERRKADEGQPMSRERR